MSYIYAYITGCIILFVFWILIYLKRKDLRRELIWASFLGLPFGFIDRFLVPTYWNPDSLFNFVRKYGVGIESFIFLFFMAGIASVIYEFLWRKKTVKLSRGSKNGFWLLFVIVFMFLVVSILIPSETIYSLISVSAIGAIITAYLRKDLLKQILTSAFIFSIFYLLVFIIVNFIFPGFVQYSYNLKSTWNILILGVPLEEIAVAFFSGAFWSTVYEFTKAYREKRLPNL